jgi:hypothetical protein
LAAEALGAAPPADALDAAAALGALGAAADGLGSADGAATAADGRGGGDGAAAAESDGAACVAGIADGAVGVAFGCPASWVYAK